jgi:hypothetical protein
MKLEFSAIIQQHQARQQSFSPQNTLGGVANPFRGWSNEITI